MKLVKNIEQNKLNEEWVHTTLQREIERLWEMLKDFPLESQFSKIVCYANVLNDEFPTVLPKHYEFAR